MKFRQNLIKLCVDYCGLLFWPTLDIISHIAVLWRLASFMTSYCCLLTLAITLSTY